MARYNLSSINPICVKGLIGRWLLVAVVPLALASGCGGDQTVSGTAGTTDVSSDVDASLLGDAADVLEGTDASTIDLGGSDASSVCPGGAGCTCGQANQCDSGYCIPTAKGQVCAKKCEISDCPADQKCVQAGGADLINICVPKTPFLCDPCSANSQCQNQANPDAKCVDSGAGGSYCGTACSAESDCLDGYTCSEIKDVTGTPGKQCVPKGTACGCSEYAIAQQLSTKCYVPTGDGKCEGKRTCLPAGATGAPTGGGLSACMAGDPKPEVCDGSDNDCDGQTDEGTCGDSNPCTDDKCGGAVGCSNPNNTLECDADGSVCTAIDKCADGKCIPGAAPDCDDKNPCTKDTCDAKLGCQHSPDDGASCNADDNPCTQGDACKASKCEAGAPKACANDDPCLVGKCGIADGICKYTFQEASPCNDGNPCTDQETCQTDTCKGKAATCDDANACTSDSCDPKTGCAHAGVSGGCDDGNKCTDKDACADSKCVGIALDVTGTCDDKNPCTQEGCDPLKGCTATPSTGGTCDDGNPCTEGDTCKDGKCASDVNNCACQADADCVAQEDGNACNGTLFCDKSAQPFNCKVKDSTIIKCDITLNSACQTNTCDAATGKCALQKKPDNLSCNADDNICTLGDVCKAGTCTPGAVQTCDDKNPCTDDVCDPKEGCQFKPNTAPCNADDNSCTENDACQQGACVAGKTKSCDSGDACIVGKCSVLSGACTYNPNDGAPCNDANACTIGDTCAKDLCKGSAASCDDGNVCTADSCVPSTGCVHAPAAGSCDDGDACTAGDTCAGSKCVGTPIDVAKICDDSNVCSTDSCDPKVGCAHADVSGNCDDGNACTTGDACAGGKCVSGTTTCSCQKDADCPDNGNLCDGAPFCDKSAMPFTCKTNPVTITVCTDPADPQCAQVACEKTTGKCVTTNASDGTLCDADKSACTAPDKCSGGVCAKGPTVDCDDKNPCTTDSCDPGSGCKHSNNTDPCDADGNACTKNDVCASGSCTPGPLQKCDDNEPCTQDSCNPADGKCIYKPIATTCSDNNICTVGDTCGTDPSSQAYTCLPGMTVSCDDNNPCTINTCDKDKGCQYPVDQTATVTCYDGANGTLGKGVCKSGKKTCDASGNLSACTGQVIPATKELCNSLDDTCDGTTDEGCAPTSFVARVGNATLTGTSGNLTARIGVGLSQASGTASGSGSVSANVGFYAWIRKIIGL